eukprot:scaffold27289_cov52-Phaeocystis_antarctica.AAC.3
MAEQKRETAPESRSSGSPSRSSAGVSIRDLFPPAPRSCTTSSTARGVKPGRDRSTRRGGAHRRYCK